MFLSIERKRNPQIKEAQLIGIFSWEEGKVRFGMVNHAGINECDITLLERDSSGEHRPIKEKIFTFTRRLNRKFDFDFYIAFSFDTCGYTILFKDIEELKKIHTLRKKYGIQFIEKNIVLYEEKKDSYECPVIKIGDTQIAKTFGFKIEDMVYSDDLKQNKYRPF